MRSAQSCECCCGSEEVSLCVVDVVGVVDASGVLSQK